jgi:hypothetical protein
VWVPIMDVFLREPTAFLCRLEAVWAVILTRSFPLR